MGRAVVEVEEVVEADEPDAHADGCEDVEAGEGVAHVAAPGEHERGRGAEHHVDEDALSELAGAVVADHVAAADLLVKGAVVAHVPVEAVNHVPGVLEEEGVVHEQAGCPVEVHPVGLEDEAVERKVHEHRRHRPAADEEVLEPERVLRRGALEVAVRPRLVDVRLGDGQLGDPLEEAHVLPLLQVPCRLRPVVARRLVPVDRVLGHLGVRRRGSPGLAVLLGRDRRRRLVGQRSSVRRHFAVGCVCVFF